MELKILRHISSMMLLVCTLAAVSPVTAFAGWQKEGDTYAYYEDDGTRVEKCFPQNQETSGSIWMKNGHLFKRTVNVRSMEKIYVFK